MGEMVPRAEDRLVFIEMDRRDQQQIVMEATGEVIDELIYTVHGRDAISWAGINHIAFWMGDVEVDDGPTWERITMFGDRVYWSVTVRARNTRYGLSSLGTAEAPEFMDVYERDERGEKVPDGQGGYRFHLEPDPHCRRKALGMAQRNGKRAVMPAAVLTRWLGYFKKFKEFNAGHLKEKPEPPFKPKLVDVDYHVRTRPPEKARDENPKGRVGPPPTLSPGSVITEDHIRYKLKAAGYGDALLPVRADGDGFAVEPTRELSDEEQYYVNGALVPLGATWISNGSRGRWTVPGRVPGR